MGGQRTGRSAAAQRRNGLRRGLACALLACVAASTAPCHASAVERSVVSVDLAPARYVMTPYLDRESGEMVAHFQPRDPALLDVAIDARTGLAWPGTMKDLTARFTRLGSELPKDVSRGTAPDLRALRELGCTPRFRSCTSPLDADILLFMGMDAGGHATLERVDLRHVFNDLDDWLQGRRAPDENRFDDADWRLVGWAAQRAPRRERWLDDVRSIDNATRFNSLRAAMTMGPRLAERPMFQRSDTDKATVDLRAELELVGHEILVRQLALSVEQSASPESTAGLAEALLAATQPPNEAGVAAHLVDVLIDRPDARRQPLAERLAREAGRRRNSTLWCFAEWMQQRACADRAAPWVPSARPLAGQASPPPGAAASASSPARVAQGGRAREERYFEGIPGSAMSDPKASGTAATATTAGSRTALDAPQEWSLIQGIPNKLLLLSFDETTGRMQPEAGAVAGFAFVARALGSVQEGRFEIQIVPSGKSPVRLVRGQYRVKARVVLDYTREDQCRGGWQCWLSQPERHAKSERRDVVFRITVDNRYTDRQPCDFGHLLPLVADDADRYLSVLKNARLAIESISRFELL